MRKFARHNDGKFSSKIQQSLCRSYGAFQAQSSSCGRYKPQVCKKSVHGVFWDKIRAHVFFVHRFFVLNFALCSDSHSLHYVAAHYVLAYSGLALCAFTLRKIRCAKRNGAKNPKQSFARQKTLEMNKQNTKKWCEKNQKQSFAKQETWKTEILWKPDIFHEINRFREK